MKKDEHWRVFIWWKKENECTKQEQFKDQFKAYIGIKIDDISNSTLDKKSPSGDDSDCWIGRLRLHFKNVLLL